jgi:hypothetical protein
MLFLVGHSFLGRPDDGSTPAEQAPVQAEPPSSAQHHDASSDDQQLDAYERSSCCNNNAVHRVFDIADLDRFICSFL